MAKVGRNDPCPCGSGKKYKRCHLGLANDPARSGGPESVVAIPLTEQQGWARAAPWIMGLVGGGLSVFAFSSVSNPAGLATLAATALVIGGWFTFGNPPPPKDDAGDPAGLNFGR